MKSIKWMIGLLLAAAPLLANGVPPHITYQGALKQSGAPATGLHNMTFRLTDVSGSAQYGSVVSLSNVAVTQGLFAVQLDFTNNGATPVLWNAITPYIQVTVDGQTLSPVEPFSSTPYSLMSASVVDGSITTAKLDTTVQNSISPAGAMIAFGGPTAPSGWLLCDGSAVSRTTYAALFQAIAITWGSGNGSTTFNLPDLRGRVPMGAGQGAGLTNRTIGTENIGEESHQLVTSEIPPNLVVNDPGHTHAITDPGHFHNQGGNGGTWPGFGIDYPILDRDGLGVGTQTRSSTTGITINTQFTGITVGGGGVPHNNIQPSAVVNYIIKI
jgi:microcystin-dependent protein